MQDKKINILNILKVVYNNKIKIGLSVFVVTFLVGIITLLLPDVYKSSATLTIPQSNTLGGLSNMISGTGGSGEGFLSQLSLGNNASLKKIRALLKTRNLKEKVVKKYDLKDKYDAEYMEDAVKELTGNMNVVEGNQGQLIIEFYNQDKDLVAPVTSYVVDCLDSINIAMTREYSSKKEEFLETRLDQVQDTLNIISSKLESVMKNNSVINLKKQGEIGTQVAGQFITQISKKKIELESLEMNKDENPKIKTVKKEIQSLQEQYDKIFYSNEAYSILPNFKTVPTVYKRLEKIRRKIKYYSSVINFLGPEYEKVKLKKLDNVPTIQVIDKPRKPNRKAKPKTILIVIITFIFTFCISSWIYIVKELKYE